MQQQGSQAEKNPKLPDHNFERCLDQSFYWYRVSLPHITGQDEFFYFRGATAREIGIGSKFKKLFDQQTYFLTRCVANVLDWNGSVLSGTATTLFELVQRYSGLDADNMPPELSEEIEADDPLVATLEMLAVSMLASVDRKTLRTADPRDYWYYLIQGKKMFEAVYGQPVDVLLPSEEGDGSKQTRMFEGLGQQHSQVQQDPRAPVNLPHSGSPNSLGFIDDGEGFSYGYGG